jgi:hypothetical protein
LKGEKVKSRNLTIWTMVLVLVATGASRADLTGYVARSVESEQVFFINFSTGEQTLLGQGNVENVKALEFSPRGLFAIGSNSLWRINTVSGAGTEIGKVSGDYMYIENLAYGPDGTLYGITAPRGTNTTADLVAINTDTGLATPICSTLPYANISAFAIDESGRGIGWRWNSDNTSECPLFEIDLTDGSTSVIGYLPGGFNGFDYGPDGILYGWKATGMGSNYLDYFYRINVENLEAVHLSTFHLGWSEFTIIPEPATLLLLGLGAVMMTKKHRSLKRGICQRYTIV